MKYALLADIHANLEALDVVLRDQKAQGCTHMACLGDIVGYCADPKECVDIIRALGMPVVKGNHDEYVGTSMPLHDFNPNGAKTVEWTRRQLSEDDRRWLRELPLVLQVEDFVIVHASVDEPHRWEYVFDKLAAARSFIRQLAGVCFFGHTHVPMAFIKDTVVRGGTYTRFMIEEGRKYFINPGSVGQSRDGVAKATYAIYDLEARTVELRRVDYDIAKAQAKIRAAGLSDRRKPPPPETDG